MSFSQLNPPIQVPRTVNELVQGMMHPDAARQGLGARRVVELLDEMLGRPSVAPSVPPLAEARGSSPGEARGSREPPAPTAQAHSRGAAPGESRGSFWPRAPAPARPAAMTFPPLPQGYAPSTLPPAPRDSDMPRSSSPAVGVASGTYPPVPPSSAAAEDDDTDFRPSFIGRLKRLFGRKRDSGF